MAFWRSTVRSRSAHQKFRPDGLPGQSSFGANSGLATERSQKPLRGVTEFLRRELTSLMRGQVALLEPSRKGLWKAAVELDGQILQP